MPGNKLQPFGVVSKKKINSELQMAKSCLPTILMGAAGISSLETFEPVDGLWYLNRSRFEDQGRRECI
jgi:hypothetical protein